MIVHVTANFADMRMFMCVFEQDFDGTLTLADGLLQLEGGSLERLFGGNERRRALQSLLAQLLEAAAPAAGEHLRVAAAHLVGALCAAQAEGGAALLVEAECAQPLAQCVHTACSLMTPEVAAADMSSSAAEAMLRGVRRAVAWLDEQH